MFIKIPLTPNSDGEFIFLNINYITKISIDKVYCKVEGTLETKLKFQVRIVTTDNTNYRLPFKDTYELAESYVKSICQGDVNEYTST